MQQMAQYGQTYLEHAGDFQEYLKNKAAPQEQAPDPEKRADHQPREGPHPGGPAPEDPAEQCGQELRDARERDQADGGQRLAPAGDAVIEIPEQQDPHDRQPTRQQDDVAHIARDRGPAAGGLEPDRHDDVVRDHGRQRDRGDDHHGGGRREAAEEGQHRQPLLPRGERDGQHEEVGVGALGQQLEPGHRDRHHEERHQHQVGREGPGGGAQVALVIVLDHEDLEHPRQAEERRPREEDQPGPATVGHLPVPEPGGGDPRHRLGQAPADPPDDEDADRHERHQLDHRLDRDRHDDAVMPFVGIEVPRPEEHREEGQSRGDPERGGGAVPLRRDVGIGQCKA